MSNEHIATFDCGFFKVSFFDRPIPPYYRAEFEWYKVPFSEHGLTASMYEALFNPRGATSIESNIPIGDEDMRLFFRDIIKTAHRNFHYVTPYILPLDDATKLLGVEESFLALLPDIAKNFDTRYSTPLINPDTLKICTGLWYGGARSLYLDPRAMFLHGVFCTLGRLYAGPEHEDLFITWVDELSYLRGKVANNLWHVFNLLKMAAYHGITVAAEVIDAARGELEGSPSDLGFSTEFLKAHKAVIVEDLPTHKPSRHNVVDLLSRKRT